MRADNAKCYGDHCEIREDCARYTRPANPLGQTWLVLAEFSQGANCIVFQPNEDDDDG